MDNDLPRGIRPVTQAMVNHVGRNLRPEHLREIAVMLPIAGDKALRHCVAEASACYGVFVPDQPAPICIAGVGQVSRLTEAAIGWVLGTPEMSRHGVFFADASRKLLPFLHRESGARRIENWIPHDYRVALRWLDWLGFTICDPEPVFGGVPHVHVLHDMEASE